MSSLLDILFGKHDIERHVMVKRVVAAMNYLAITRTDVEGVLPFTIIEREMIELSRESSLAEPHGSGRTTICVWTRQ